MSVNAFSKKMRMERYLILTWPFCNVSMMIYLLTGIRTLLEHQSKGYRSKSSLSRIGPIFSYYHFVKLLFGKELKNKKTYKPTKRIKGKRNNEQ